jgi:hypothetical protein
MLFFQRQMGENTLDSYSFVCAIFAQGKRTKICLLKTAFPLLASLCCEKPLRPLR